MRLYRCLKCRCGFAIFMKRGKENKGGKGITCPLCASSEEIEEGDPVEEIGATLAKRALAWWKTLPSGD